MIFVRNAELADVKLVFDLSNDPEIRKVSFSTTAIDWDQHQIWFADAVRRPDLVFLLGFVDADMKHDLVGQVRFQIMSPDLAEISISLHSQFRGRGVGPDLLRRTLNYLRQKNTIRFVRARVKETNEASCRFFLKNGFRCTGKLDPEVGEAFVMQYTLEL